MPGKLEAGRFRALVEHSADAIWMLSESAAVVYANPASGAVLGYSPDELTGANAFDFFLPSDREAARERLCGRESSAAPFRMRRKDGKVIWVEVAGANRLDDPHVQGVIVSLRDVTEARRAEQALRDSESRFRALVESSSDGFALLDREGTILHTGPPVLGHQPGKFLGRSILELIHPDDLERIIGDLAAVAGGPARRTEQEYRVRHSDGSWRWVEIGMKNLLANPAVAGIVVNYRDVTERRAREEELRQARDQVRQILESIRESFIALDREWRFTYVNRRVADAIGKTPDELMGRNIWEAFPAARDTEFYPAYRRVMTERVPVQFEMLYPPNGRWFDVHAYPTVEGLAAYILDITGRKRAELRAAALHEVTRALLEAPGLTDFAPRVLRALREGLGWPEAVFWRVDATRQFLKPWRVKAGRILAKAEGVAGEAWACGRAAWRSGPSGSAVAFPVRRGSETIGVMEFSSQDARERDDDQLALMDAIAIQIAQVLEQQL